MQTIIFNGSYVATDGQYIAIADTIREAQIQLIQQIPKKQHKKSLSEIINQAKRARQTARLVNFF